MNNNKLIFALSIVAVAFTTRFFPHPPNFTAVGSIALFCGAYFKDKKFAALLPLVAMLISDLFIGFHSTMISVYACFAFTTILGFAMAGKVKVLNVLAGSLLSAIIFFVVTNFAVWYGSDFYPQNSAGLMESYTSAIPFFANNVAANVFYSALLFGGFEVVSRRLEPVMVK